MAIRATLLVLAATMQCHSAPAVQATGPTQPDATRLPQGTATQEPTAGRLPGKDNAAMPVPSDAPGAEDASPCLDAELQKRGLDKYGNEPGTMYPGGTPLFDEATGKRKDRTAFVYAHHPEIAQACSAADGGR
jgi:hypothetical protein